MIFHDRFRTAWWLVLLVISSLYLIGRSNELLIGNVNFLDLFVFIPWFALMLVPIFQEMDFLGFKFKQEITTEVKSLRTDVKEQILNLRTDVHNSIDFKQNYNPVINVGAPLSDTELNSIENNLEEIVNRAFLQRGFSKPDESVLSFSSSDDIVYLFRVRYEIETELRRLALTIGLKPGSHLYGFRLIQNLTDVLIPEEISVLMQQVWRICTPAIHGEQPSDTQIKFVKASYDEFMPFLKSIEISV